MIVVTNKQRTLLMAIAIIAVAGVAVIIIITTTTTTTTATVGFLVTDSSTVTVTTTTYNPDMTDWWDDMIEHLDDEKSKIWTEPAWGDEIWVEIEDLGNDMYRISLHGIAASGQPIVYTITETATGYDKYGPALPDGSMDSRSYIKINEGEGTAPIEGYAHIDHVPVTQAIHPFPINSITHHASNDTITVVFEGGTHPSSGAVTNFEYSDSYAVNESFAFGCYESGDYAYLVFYGYLGTVTVNNTTHMRLLHYDGMTQDPMQCAYPDVIRHSKSAIPENIDYN